MLLLLWHINAPEPKMRAWNVFNSTGKKVDTVFFNSNLDKDWVLDSLIKHDGLPKDTVVKLRRVKKS